MAKLNCSEDLKKLMLDFIYPIGSVYITVEPGNPSSKFGGSWVRLKNGYLFGVQDDTRVRGELGSPSDTGDATRANNHSLTTEQLPAHNHRSTYWNGSEPVCMSYIGGSGVGFNLSWERVGMANSESNLTTSYTGSGWGHSHSIPYLAVIIWRRTA